MSIKTILEKIDAVIDAAIKENRQITREAIFELDTEYNRYAPSVASPVQQAKEIKRDREINLTNNKNKRIKDAFITLQTAETRRFAFISTASSYIFDPAEFDADAIKSIGEKLKNDERALNKSSSDVKDIINTTDLSPRPTIISVNCRESTIPFGKRFDIEFTVTNPSDKQLNTATANINIGGETACSEIDIAPIDSGEVVTVQREIASPIAEEQLIEVSVNSPTLDVGRGGQARIDIRSKKSYASFAIDNIATLENTIDESKSIPSEQKETIIVELEAAIEATTRARKTAKEDSENSDTKEKYRAQEVNSLFEAAKKSLAQAKREYAVITKTNNVPVETDATIRNHFILSDRNLSEGQIAGLSGSGENGQPRESTTTSTVCEPSSSQAEGTRVQTDHVITGNQDTILISIYVTELYEEGTISLIDSFDSRLRVVEKDSDGKVANDGKIRFENIEFSDSTHIVKRQYRIAPSENLDAEELPANFRTGPTEVEFNDNSDRTHTIGQPDWIVVTTESQDN